jgi:hypothetical protein
MNDRRFIVTKTEDTFLLGRFEDEKVSGVFLTPEYVERLREIRNAAWRRLEAVGGEIPDALKNLLGVIDRLTVTHSIQIRAEGSGSQADRDELARLEQEMDELASQLGGFPRGPSGPKRA